MIQTGFSSLCRDEDCDRTPVLNRRVGRSRQCEMVTEVNQLMTYTHRSVRLSALIRDASFTVDCGD